MIIRFETLCGCSVTEEWKGNFRSSQVLLRPIMEPPRVTPCTGIIKIPEVKSRAFKFVGRYSNIYIYREIS